MLINERDDTRLNEFIEQSMNFLEDRAGEYIYYGKESEDHTLRLPDGTIVPTSKEEPLILIHEYRSFIANTAHEFLNVLIQNLGNELFGFAERPMYEMITKWLFTATSDEIGESNRIRIKTLLLAGNYKFLDEFKNKDKLNQILEYAKDSLDEEDIKYLHKDNFKKYYHHLWDEVVKPIAKEYRNHSHSFLDGDVNYKEILKYQHMRVHANPLLINESLETGIDKTVRHKLLVAFYLRQMIDYYRYTNNTEWSKLKYSYQKFIKNSSLSV